MTNKSNTLKDAINQTPFLVEKVCHAKVHDTDYYQTIYRFLRLNDEICHIAMSVSDGGDFKKVLPYLQNAGAKGGDLAKFASAVNRIASNAVPSLGMIVMRGGWLPDGKSFALPDSVSKSTRPGVSPEHRFFLAPNFDLKRNWQLVTASGDKTPDEAHLTVMGTSKQWKQKIAGPALNSSPMVLGICAALAAPLLKPAGLDPFGILYSGDTSTGKTSCTLVAGSVIGIGNASKLWHWHATAAGLEQLTELHADTLLPIDDIANVSARPTEIYNAIVENAYRWSSGGTKRTNTKAKSNITGRPVPTGIKTIVITSHEKSLEQIAREARKAINGGVLPRFLEIPIEASADGGVFDRLSAVSPGDDLVARCGALADDIRSACGRYHGQVFVEWLNLIIQDVPVTVKNVSAGSKEFLEHASFKKDSGLEKRHADRFAFLYGVGRHAIRNDILPWTEKQLLSAMLKVHGASRETIRQSTKNDHLTVAQQRLWSLLRDHSKVVSASSVGDGKAFEGWYRVFSRTVAAFVSGRTWREMFDSKRQRDTFEAFLLEKGVLKTPATVELRQPRLPKRKDKFKRSVELVFPLNAKRKAMKPYKPDSQVGPAA